MGTRRSGLLRSVCWVTLFVAGPFSWWCVVPSRFASSAQRDTRHNVALAALAADFVVSLGQDGHVLSQGTVSEALVTNEALPEEIGTKETEDPRRTKLLTTYFPRLPKGRRSS